MEHSRNGDLAEGRDGDADGNQAIMMDDEQERWLTATSDEELYFRRHALSKQFTAALHSLLVSSSRQEVMNYFAQFQPNQQRFLYKVFALTVMQVRENIAAEFRSICKETQILEALDHINSEQFLRATEVRQSISPKKVVREVAIKRKQEEVNVMKQKLLQTNEENDLLAAQLEGLQEKVDAARDLRSVDAVIQKISNMNLKLAKVLENPFSGETSLIHSDVEDTSAVKDPFHNKKPSVVFGAKLQGLLVLCLQEQFKDLTRSRMDKMEPTVSEMIEGEPSELLLLEHNNEDFKVK